MPVKGTLNLTINGVMLTMPDSIGNLSKFLIKPQTVQLQHTAQLVSVTNGDSTIENRFQPNFLQEVATISTSAAATDGGWRDASNPEEMNAFLKGDASELPNDNMRNFVVSVQVVLIDAAKAAQQGGTYEANDVAIIQFPLYRSNPDPKGAYGGRRRTKMAKRNPKYRTRKNKK